MPHTRQALNTRFKTCARQPVTYGRDLATAYPALDFYFNKTSYLWKSIRSYQEVIALEREAMKHGTSSSHKLALKLNELGHNMNRRVGRSYQAYHLLQESVSIYRTLVQNKPDIYTKYIEIAEGNLEKCCWGMKPEKIRRSLKRIVWLFPRY